MTPFVFGAQLWSQHTSWADFEAAALDAEAAGWDEVWTWDHLMAIFGPWEQTLFEGWTAMAALAAKTTRVRLGLMVGANTFRNPGLTAKVVTTLDHISNGRAILGIGGAWFEREHEAYGIPFGSGFGERLDMLDEAVELMRRLLDGERFSHDGRFYRFQDALLAPLPIQERLPILIGGSGPRKTLHTTARLADAWNTSGWLEEVREKVGNLERRCEEVGRDPAEIERTVSFPIVIRPSRSEAEAAFAEILALNESPDAGNVPNLLGPVEYVADEIRPFKEQLGFRHVIARMPAPFDRPTIEAVGGLRRLLDS